MVSSPCFFPQHKLLKEFNNKAGKLEAPEWIFLVEHHRHDYDPEIDRRINYLVVNKLGKKEHALFIENARDETVDLNSHSQTRNWKFICPVYGCFDPEAFRQTDAIHNLFLELLELYADFKDDVPKKVQKILEQKWQSKWTKEEIPFPNTALTDQDYKQDLKIFLNNLWELRIKKINSSFLLHAISIVSMLEENSALPMIYIAIGKNHLAIPKKLKLLLNELASPKKEPIEEGIERLYDYLEASGKWAVILKPKPQPKKDIVCSA